MIGVVCDYCKKTRCISAVIPCRCGKNVCLMCRHPTNHECDFDYKTYDRQKLFKKLPRVVAPKV